jgi:hypothetical protein
MLIALQQILLFVSAWIIVVPVLISLLLFRRFGTGLKVLSIHVFIACAVELIAYVLMQQNRNNLPLLHAYTLSEFILLYVFYEYFIGNRYNKWWMRGIAFCFVLFSLVNSLFIQSIYTFNSYARGLEALLLLLLALLCFYKISVRGRTGYNPVIWINTGILLYFSGAFTLFILSNYILPMGYRLNVQIWAVHSFLSILLYTFISIGLWKGRNI